MNLKTSLLLNFKNEQKLTDRPVLGRVGKTNHLKF